MAGKKLKRDIDGCAPLVSEGQTVTVCMRKTGTPTKTPLTFAGAACAMVRNAAYSDRENFLAIHLDVRNQPIGTEIIGKGLLSAVDVHPREVFKGAILNNAANIILAHNHPSGIAAPSPADIQLTERLSASGKVLGIGILDHVIVSTTGCESLRARHDGEDIHWAGAYEPDPAHPPRAPRKRR